MRNRNDDVMGQLILLPFFFFLGLLIALYQAWAVQIVWSQHLTAYAPVPDIVSIAAAALIFSLFKGSRNVEDQSYWALLLEAALAPLFMLLFSWALTFV